MNKTSIKTLLAVQEDIVNEFEIKEEWMFGELFGMFDGGQRVNAKLSEIANRHNITYEEIQYIFSFYLDHIEKLSEILDKIPREIVEEAVFGKY